MWQYWQSWPAFGIFAFEQTGLGYAIVVFAILILQWTTPVAVTSFLLAEKYGADAQPVAELVVASSPMSVLKSASFANNFASTRRNVCSLITTFSIRSLAQQYMSEI